MAAPEDIDIAARLAEDKALVVTLQDQLIKDGYFTADHKVSPAATLLNTVSNRVLRFSRFLQLHPRGRTGHQSRSLNKSRAAARKAAETLDAFKDDPLIKTH